MYDAKIWTFFFFFFFSPHFTSLLLYYTAYILDRTMNSRRVSKPKSGCLSFLVSLFRRGRICYHFKLLLPEFWETGCLAKRRERRAPTFYSVGCCRRRAVTSRRRATAAVLSLSRRGAVSRRCMSKAADAPRQICSSRTRELVFEKRSFLWSSSSPPFFYSAYLIGRNDPLFSYVKTCIQPASLIWLLVDRSVGGREGRTPLLNMQCC